jgi:hypothetical protein
MGTIIFYIYMLVGVITPAGNVDGRPIYNVDSCRAHIDNAYKGEIVRWIETGEFKYDEDCRDIYVINKSK